MCELVASRVGRICEPASSLCSRVCIFPLAFSLSIPSVRTHTCFHFLFLLARISSGHNIFASGHHPHHIYISILLFHHRKSAKGQLTSIGGRRHNVPHHPSRNHTGTHTGTHTAMRTPIMAPHLPSLRRRFVSNTEIEVLPRLLLRSISVPRVQQIDADVCKGLPTAQLRHSVLPYIKFPAIPHYQPHRHALLQAAPPPVASKKAVPTPVGTPISVGRAEVGGNRACPRVGN